MYEKMSELIKYDRKVICESLASVDVIENNKDVLIDLYIPEVTMELIVLISKNDKLLEDFVSSIVKEDRTKSICRMLEDDVLLETIDIIKKLPVSKEKVKKFCDSFKE